MEVEDSIGLSDPWASCALVAQLKGRGDRGSPCGDHFEFEKGEVFHLKILIALNY